MTTFVKGQRVMPANGTIDGLEIKGFGTVVETFEDGYVWVQWDVEHGAMWEDHIDGTLFTNLWSCQGWEIAPFVMENE